MKILFNLPKENLKLKEELITSNWNRLKEPKNITLATIYSIPIILFLIIISTLWIYLISPEFREIFMAKNFSMSIKINLNVLVYLIYILIFLFIHEILHLIFIPNFLNSEKTYLGFNGIFGFVYTEEVIVKNRYILIAIMPLIILSFILPIFLSLFGKLSSFAIFLCVLNAGGSCVDVLNIILIAKQIPKNSMIISNGNTTYYK